MYSESRDGRMAVEAVIFDMDGVLIDSEEYWWQARVEFADSIGKPWTMDDHHACMGRSTADWAAVMKQRMAIDLPIEDIMRETKKRVISRLEAHLPLLPGAVEAVHLAASEYPVALASGSPTEVIEKVMSLTELDRVFKVMIFGDNIARGKPAPDIYLVTAQELGLPASMCVGIEDSGNGLRALKAAGMYSIAAPSPGFPLTPDLLELADLALPSLENFSLDMVRSLG